MAWSSNRGSPCPRNSLAKKGVTPCSRPSSTPSEPKTSLPCVRLCFRNKLTKLPDLTSNLEKIGKTERDVLMGVQNVSDQARVWETLKQTPTVLTIT